MITEVVYDWLKWVEGFLCSRCKHSKRCEKAAYFCPAARKLAKLIEDIHQILELLEE